MFSQMSWRPARGRVPGGGARGRRGRAPGEVDHGEVVLRRREVAVEAEVDAVGRAAVAVAAAEAAVDELRQDAAAHRAVLHAFRAGVQDALDDGVVALEDRIADEQHRARLVVGRVAARVPAVDAAVVDGAHDDEAAKVGQHHGERRRPDERVALPQRRARAPVRRRGGCPRHAHCLVRSQSVPGVVICCCTSA